MDNSEYIKLCCGNGGNQGKYRYSEEYIYGMIPASSAGPYGSSCKDSKGTENQV